MARASEEPQPAEPNSAPQHSRIEGTPALAGSAEPVEFNELFERYGPYVARVALRILGRDDEVEDVVQEVFAIAIRKYPDLRQVTSVRHWLARIAVRRSLNLLRKRRLLGVLGIGEEVDFDSFASADASPEDRTRVTRLYRALDRVPAADRVAWTLRVVEGEQLADVATICGCSLATVKRRIARVQGQLQEVLGDE